MDKKRLLIGLVILLLAVFALSIFVGRYPRPYWMPLNVLLNEKLAQKLVFSLRIPRLLMAALLGMTLAACGEVLQMLFQNPIVEPGFLGVSQGAAFGASLAILFFGGSLVNIEIMAAFFALLGLALSFAISRLIKFGGWVLRLVLSGIVVSAIMSSGLGILKYIADPLTELQEITFWLLGGLWSTTWSDVLFVLPIVAVCLIIVLLMRWRLNVLSLNDATAFSLGAATTRERVFLLTVAVIGVAAVTSISGIVNWVGLIVPHISRRLFGSNAQYSLPGSILIGGIFTIICDVIARTVLAGEIPLGIITSFLGAVIFIVLMSHEQLRVVSRE
ncbi:MAG: iron complex transport system permease protein [Chloroflexota bacterium]|nr:iron complex transport system permease protein [Chloroflexota bacterium]